MPKSEPVVRTREAPPVPHAPEFPHAPDAPVAPEVEGRIQELMRQPYRIVVQANPDEGGYVASVRELPNCIAAGETIEETVELLREAMEAWFLVALEHGRPLPEPMADEAGYSDQLRVRLPERLHRELAEQAAREGMSLNTLIVSYLAREAGVHPGGD